MNRAAKKGLWALKDFEHPADYKKRIKAAEEGMAGVEETAKNVKRSVTADVGKSLWGFISGRK